MTAARRGRSGPSRGANTAEGVLKHYLICKRIYCTPAFGSADGNGPDGGNSLFRFPALFRAEYKPNNNETGGGAASGRRKSKIPKTFLLPVSVGKISISMDGAAVKINRRTDRKITRPDNILTQYEC